MHKLVASEFNIGTYIMWKYYNCEWLYRAYFLLLSFMTDNRLVSSGVIIIQQQYQ